MNDIKITHISIVSTHLKKQVLRNIQDAVTHVLTSELIYLSPSDRMIGLIVEGAISKDDMVSLVITITPYYKHVNESDEFPQQKLHKYIVLATNIHLRDLLTELKKEIQWVLDYFGLTIMYITKSFKSIRIEKVGKGYTLEYSNK